MPLTGKVALVTGGARRLGEAMALGLAARGARVGVHYRRSEAEAMALCGRLGGGAFGVCGDLATAEGCNRVWEETVARAGGVDILVNNAAVFLGDDAPVAELARMRAVNVEAALQLAVRFRKQGRPGVVIQLLDCRIARATGMDGPFATYAAGKRELAEAVERLAREYAPEVRVVGLAPGPVLAPEMGHERAGGTLLGRRPMPEDVAEAAVFLAEARAVTGQILYVDSGARFCFPSP